MIRLSFVLLSILSSCLPDETISGQTQSSDVWVLQNPSGNSEDNPVTISFPEKGRIAGQAHCNRYFANQSAPLPWIEITEIGSTKMVCPDLEEEALYFKFLKSATTVEIAGDTLIMQSETGDTLIFKKN